MIEREDGGWGVRDLRTRQLLILLMKDHFRYNSSDTAKVCSGGLSFMERIAMVSISTDFYVRIWSIALILHSSAIPGGFQHLFL